MVCILSAQLSCLALLPSWGQIARVDERFLGDAVVIHNARPEVIPGFIDTAGGLVGFSEFENHFL